MSTLSLLSCDEFYCFSHYIDYIDLKNIYNINTRTNKIYRSDKKIQKLVHKKREEYISKKYGKAESMMMSFVHKNNLKGLQHLKIHGWDYGLRFNMNNNAAIKAAAFSSSPETIRFLLSDPDVSPSTNNNTPLLNAIQRQDNEIVKIFLYEAKVDPSVPNNEPLLNAIKTSNVELVQMLIDLKINASEYNHIPTESWQYQSTPLIVACTYGNTKIVKILLKNKQIDPSEFENRAIINAACAGFSEIVEILLTYPHVDPSAQNNKAINEASRKSYLKVVDLLIRDPRLNPPYEAILETIQSGKFDLFEILMRGEGVYPSFKNNLFLIEACKRGNVDIVEYLLKYCDPSIQNNLPLIEASKNGNYATVQLLLADLRVNVADQNGLAITVAIEKKHTDIAALLLNAPQASESIYKKGLSGQITVTTILNQEQLIDDINEALTENNRRKLEQLLINELSVHTVIEVLKYVKSSLGTISPRILYQYPNFRNIAKMLI